jgi:hypothetical protein
MPKKACCCNNKCSWCDRDHWTFDPYEIFDPVTGEGILIQNTQPNWNILGTITTELPSVGHPMLSYLFNQDGVIDCIQGVPGACETKSTPAINPDSAPRQEDPLCRTDCGYTGQFRTPSILMDRDPVVWGSAYYYGDINPCWFNGINMTNIDVFSSSRGTSGATGISGCCSAVGCCGASGYIGTDACCGPTGMCCSPGLSGASGSTASDDNHFFNFTFELKVEKLTGSISGQCGSSGGTYSTVIDIKRTGPGKNVRPHPDACRSFNVNETAWGELSGCNVFFHTEDDQGQFLPCTRDFARMPRGPWPYKFKNYELPDCSSPACWTQNFVGSSGDNAPFTSTQVRDALKDPSSAADYPWILNCPFIKLPCGGINPTSSGGGASGYCDGLIPEYNIGIVECCQTGFLDDNQLCNQLDPYNGTPFGWEDCPPDCATYSNYSIPDPITGEVNTENLHFFGWINAFNRYTTPEWDLYEGSGSTSGTTSGITKKISLHVIVPSQYDFFGEVFGNAFCQPNPSSFGTSFGEWCFGMDYEATDEIEALQSAGYVWSNGREDDGIWINRTPTSALRVLFTLDHSDIAPGKVWRVFRDWDVIVCNRIKTFNKGTPQEATFKITIKQKVEEVQFSSMGCDCPSGYFINECGKIEGIEDACDAHQVVDGDVVYPNESPWAQCWGSNIDGPNGPIAGRVSFSERGPIAIRAIVETDETGCVNCRDPAIRPITCSEKRGSRAHPLNESDESDSGGQIFIVDQGNLDCVGPGCVKLYNSEVSWYFNDTSGDLINTYGINLSGLRVSCTPVPWNGREDAPVPQAIYDLFTKHGPRWSGAIADIPHSGGVYGVGNLRYRDGYLALKISENSQATEIIHGGPDHIHWGIYDHLYGDSQCAGMNCQNENLLSREIYEYARIFIDEHPTLAPIGNCYINCSCGAPGYQNEPDTSGNCYLCPNGLPPPCSDVGWSGPVEVGPWERCPCQQTNGTDKIFPSYACNDNIARINGRGANDYTYTCSPARPADMMRGFCEDDASFVPQPIIRFGINSERFYFTSYATVATATGLGEFGCAKACQCGAIESNPGCFNLDGSCKFCEGSGGLVGIGFPNNMFINWKKYLCKKRAQQGFKIPPDIMQKFEWKCSSNDAPNPGLCGANEGLTGLGCSTAWSISSCVVAQTPINNLSYTIEELETITNLSPQYRIQFKKYLYNEQLNQGIQGEDPRMCEWDTTYEPNTARSGLTYGRNHIIINAQGPY